MYNINNRIHTLLSGEIKDLSGNTMIFDQATRISYFNALTGIFPDYLKYYDSKSVNLTGDYRGDTLILDTMKASNVSPTEDALKIAQRDAILRKQELMSPMNNLYNGYNQYVAKSQMSKTLSTQSNKDALSTSKSEASTFTTVSSSNYASPSDSYTRQNPDYDSATSSFSTLNDATSQISDFSNYGVPGGNSGSYGSAQNASSSFLNSAQNEAFKDEFDRYEGMQANTFGATDNPLLQGGIGGNIVNLDLSKFNIIPCVDLGNLNFQITAALSGMFGLQLSGEFCEKFDAAIASAFEESPYLGIFLMWRDLYDNFIAKQDNGKNAKTVVESLWDSIKLTKAELGLNTFGYKWDSTNGSPASKEPSPINNPLLPAASAPPTSSLGGTQSAVGAARMAQMEQCKAQADAEYREQQIQAAAKKNFDYFCIGVNTIN